MTLLEAQVGARGLLPASLMGVSRLRFLHLISAFLQRGLMKLPKGIEVTLKGKVKWFGKQVRAGIL